MSGGGAVGDAEGDVISVSQGGCYRVRSRVVREIYMCCDVHLLVGVSFVQCLPACRVLDGAGVQSS